MADTDTVPSPKRTYLHLWIRPELRDRARLCAEAEGLSLPEFVRGAVADRCYQVERREGQRRRMAAGNS